MNRKQFEHQLLEMGFTPISFDGGCDRYALSGGTLFGHRNRNTTITTHKEGFFVMHTTQEGMTFGRSYRWSSCQSSASKIIKKFFSDFRI